FVIVLELATTPGHVQRGVVADVAGVLGNQELGVGDIGIIGIAEVRRLHGVIVVVVHRALAAGVVGGQRGQLQDVVGIDVPVQLGIRVRAVVAVERLGRRGDAVADAGVLVLEIVRA